MPVGEYIAGQPQPQRAILQSAFDYVRQFPDAEIEGANVGLFVKLRRSFIELRPKSKWVVLSFILPVRIDHPRIRRSVAWGQNFGHYVQLNTPADFDDTVRQWLQLSYEHHAG
jgi:hypothetical protein